MVLHLQRLPAVRGIYGPNRDLMPRRALLLHPDACASFLGLEATNPLVYSDIFRSAESSLAAVQAGRGAQPPGYSGHNYGLAVDVAVDETLKRHGWKYAQLLSFLAERGWHCYCRDGKRGKEDWHFNFLGTNAGRILQLVDPTRRSTWATAAELLIKTYYPDALTLSPGGIQQCLAKIGFYRGEIDGLLGPLSRQAIAAFARAWGLDPEATLSPRLQRTLAYVSAELRIVDPIS